MSGGGAIFIDFKLYSSPIRHLHRFGVAEPKIVFPFSGATLHKRLMALDSVPVTSVSVARLRDLARRLGMSQPENEDLSQKASWSQAESQPCGNGFVLMKKGDLYLVLTSIMIRLLQESRDDTRPLWGRH